MKLFTRLIIIELIATCFANIASAQLTECDSLRSCTQFALTLTNTSGQTAHYVDVTKTASLNTITNAITVEMWFNAKRQSGKVQYLAGLWGPSNDINDVWVLYINSNDELVFEINGTGTNNKSLDNTVASVDFSTNYDTWHHIAAVFDGADRTARIYLDGNQVATGTNPAYPAMGLRPLANQELSIQIGSTNALSNDFNLHRTFLGQMDEIRIWNRARPADEIFCEYYKWYNGNEDGLVLFYRCNQLPDNYFLCDATANGNTGLARSGARCENGNRPLRRTYFVESLDQEIPLEDTLRCVDSKTYRFSVRDTSSCERSVWMRVIDQGNGRYTINPDRIENMVKDQVYFFEVTVDGDFTGNVRNRLQVLPLGGFCEWNTTFWMDLTRITELDYQTDELDFGLLTANCIEEPYRELQVLVCNNTQETGTNRTVTITDIISSNPQYFQVVTPLPVVIPEGECFYIDVRFTSGNSSEELEETLTLISDDQCGGSKTINLLGEVQEVISIRSGDFRLDSIDFGRVCVNFASDPVQYSWENLMDEDIFVTDIIFPEHFYGVSYTFPVTLEPETGYLPDFFRFAPQSEGTFQDTIFFIVDAGDCTIRKPVVVKGEGYSPDLEFSISGYDFGDVLVGQESVVGVTVRNNGPVEARVVVYLRNGDSYFLEGARAINVPANSTASFPLTFRPELAQEYIDEVCFFEQTCYESGCIEIRGRGILERFEFIPPTLEIENVIACQSENGNISIVNRSNETQVLRNFVFDNPSGKFEFVNPADIATLGNVVLDAGEQLDFELRYNPADLTDDRADRSFIRFETADNEDWNAKLFGSSVTPKIFVTERTDFGVLEIGDTRIRNLIIENISVFDLRIDSINIPQGFVRLLPNAAWNGQTLAPGETIDVTIEFIPTEPIDYSGQIRVYSNSPCLDIMQTGSLEGRGQIVPLEVPIDVVSFGFVMPCDCLVREIQLINKSQVHEMLIDSVWIDGENVADSTPWHFSWSSAYYQLLGEQLPYSIPPDSRDTLRIIYCPDTPAMRDSINHAARIHIKASGNSWQRDFDTYISGKRALIIEPNKLEVNFPPTPVDTFAREEYVEYFIPDISVNPERESVKIDSITFLPDDRVFFATILREDSTIQLPPALLDSSFNYIIQVDFRPRAVREYEARMVIHYSEPCIDNDTTVIVRGSSFAQAFGLSFAFELNREERDTFRVINCDTLIVPIYSNRLFPAEFVDMLFSVRYDTTKLRYIESESRYLENSCFPHDPFIEELATDYGSEMLLKNFCNVDSLAPFIEMKFVPMQMQRDTFDIAVDSIRFDTEEVILYDIIAEPDYATVIVLQPDFDIKNDINFDSVRVLDCAERQFFIENTGDVPLSASQIIELPNDVTLIGAIPGFDIPVEPGDSIEILLEFCPRRSSQLDTISFAESNFPCALDDTVRIQGVGFAPEFDVTVDFADNFEIPDIINAPLGTEISIPVKFNKNFADTIDNIEYWLEGLEFEISFDYNQRSLKYLQTRNLINGNLEEDVILGNIILNYSGVDSLKAETIAEMDFLVTIPELMETPISISSANFDTDSILFLEIRPKGSVGTIQTQGECNITYLEFGNTITTLNPPIPNPWNQQADIEFNLGERSNPILRFYDINGRLIFEALDGSMQYEPGIYNVQISTNEFSPGLYYYILEAGIYRRTQSMIVND